MDTNNNIDLLEKYLNNELSGEEMRDLDQQISTNEELAAEFAKRKTAHEAIDFMIAQNLKSELEEMEMEVKETKVISLQKRRTNRILLLSLAASFLLLIGYFSIFLPQSTSSGQELAFANYKAPDYSLRSSNTPNYQHVLSRGIDALKQQQYQTAIASLDSVDVNDEYYIIAQFYLAHAYYQAEQYQQAEDIFELVSASNDIRYMEEADWYGLLACLAHEGGCTEKLDAIAKNNNHTYQQQTISMQKQLKNK